MPAFFNAISQAPSSGFITTDLIWHIDPTNTLSYPGSGSVIYDLVNDKDGTFNGNVYVDANKHLRFDGISDFLSFGTILTTDPLSLIGTSYTISCWLYYVGTGDNFPHMFSLWRTTSQATSDGLLFYAGRTSRGAGHYHNDGTGSTQYSSASSGVTITLNTWQYWSAWYDYSTGNAKIFRNGVQAASFSGMKQITNTDKLLRVGASNYDTFSDWNGRIGSFHAHSRALSDSEILQNYNATKSAYGL